MAGSGFNRINGGSGGISPDELYKLIPNTRTLIPGEGTVSGSYEYFEATANYMHLGSYGDFGFDIVITPPTVAQNGQWFGVQKNNVAGNIHFLGFNATEIAQLLPGGVLTEQYDRIYFHHYDGAWHPAFVGGGMFASQSDLSSFLQNGNGTTVVNGNQVDIGGTFLNDTFINGNQKMLILGEQSPTGYFSFTNINSQQLLIQSYSDYLSAPYLGSTFNINPSIVSLNNNITGHTNTSVYVSGANSLLSYSDDSKVELYINGIDRGESFTINGVTITEGIDFSTVGIEWDGEAIATVLENLDYSATGLNIPHFIGVFRSYNKIIFQFATNITTYSQNLLNAWISGLAQYSTVTTDLSGVRLSVVSHNNGSSISALNLGKDSHEFLDGTLQKNGLQYAEDYSATYTNRSLVDKGYVTNNYIKKSGDDVLGTLNFGTVGLIANDTDWTNQTNYSEYLPDNGSSKNILRSIYVPGGGTYSSPNVYAQFYQINAQNTLESVDGTNYSSLNTISTSFILEHGNGVSAGKYVGVDDYIYAEHHDAFGKGGFELDKYGFSIYNKPTNVNASDSTKGTISAENLTTQRTYLLPNASGTFALTTDVATGDTATLNSAKSYADGLVTGLWDDRGSFDASVNAYPSSGGSGTAGAILKGDIWTVSVAGTLPTGVVVEIGDTVRALVDTPGNTQSNWAVAQQNIGYVPENVANKDASGGYAGLTNFKINLRNIANTITSFFTNSNTVSRTYTLPDKDGTVAMTSDITGTNSGTNTGDETASSIATINHGATAKTTPVDADEITGQDSANSFSLIRITLSNLWTNYIKGKADSVYVALTGVADNVFTLYNSTTTSKKVQFLLSSISAATTRTWTFPDANDTFVGTTGTQTLTNKTLTTPTIASVKGTITTDTDGAIITFDKNVSTVHQVTLGGNRTLALSNMAAGDRIILNLIQDGTGSRTVTWFSTIKWVGGVAPTLTTTANKTDSFGFLCTSAGNYIGYVLGQNI